MGQIPQAGQIIEGFATADRENFPDVCQIVETFQAGKTWIVPDTKVIEMCQVAQALQAG